MSKFIFSVLLTISIFAVSIAAQDETERYSSGRLENLINQLKRQTVDLVDRTSEDLSRNSTNSRADLEAAFLAQQLDASAGLFSQLVRDGRRASELRDASAILSDLTRRAPGGVNGNLWRDANRTIIDINRELGSGNGNSGGNNGGGNGGNNGGNNPPPSNGRAFWRGTVDKEVQLIVSTRDIETRTISGTPYTDENFSFTASMPTRNVQVNVVKRRGRGNVRVIEQPSRDNDYTATIQILDNDGGAKEYELEINWR